MPCARCRAWWGRIQEKRNPTESEYPLAVECGYGAVGQDTAYLLEVHSVKIRKLLVIDDEPDMSDFIRDVAVTVGYEAIATYRSDVFKRVYTADLDIVVLDLVIPWANGIDLIRFLADSHCQASIILISGFDPNVLDSARTLAREHGLKTIGTLTKPISSGDLIALLKEQPVTSKT